MSWAQALARWDVVSNDFQQLYGIDLTRDYLERTPWPSLRLRLRGLFDTDCRTSRAFRN